MFNKKIYIIVAIILFSASIMVLLLCGGNKKNIFEQKNNECEETKVEEPILKFGLPIDDYTIVYDTIKPNQTLAEVLYGFGFTSRQIYDLTQCPDTLFDARRIRPGQVCALFTSKDSIQMPQYLIYEESAKRYVTFDLQNGYKATVNIVPSEWRESEVAGTVAS